MQDFTLTMYLNQYWHDKRLAFRKDNQSKFIFRINDLSLQEDWQRKNVLTLPGEFAEKIWVPDTFFANDKNRSVNVKNINNV